MGDLVVSHPGPGVVDALREYMYFVPLSQQFHQGNRIAFSPATSG
jgi:hypothetical protein